MALNNLKKSMIFTLIFVALVGCQTENDERESPVALKIAEGIYGQPGEMVTFATEAQEATFIRGEEVVQRRFTLEEGLGPLFNVSFCGACHEKPTFGGSAGHYRDFYIYGERLPGGSFSASGPRSGVLSTFEFITPPSSQTEEVAPSLMVTKREAELEANLMTLRNPIPFFGIGLIAQISEEAILANVDPTDLDGDGISGRPNYDQGYVGRFGLKAQTVSIENFIRGPLFNHLGITTNPLPAERQAELPVPSVAEERDAEVEIQNLEGPLQLEVHTLPQAAAPSEPLTDSDETPDPEMSSDDLFDLVSWAMLLAAPMPDPMSAESELGQGLFHAVQCASCHIPSLESPRGAIPAYSDLLLHDMGEEMADGVVMGLATGHEFRTQPLWGVSATGPYLYDGRAHTLTEAILFHDGEAEESREAFEALTTDEQSSLIEFLMSLGGRAVRSEGLISPQATPPQSGEAGGPYRALTEAEAPQWAAGRALFDHDFGFSEGLGPIFNGDSCRGCHFDPFVGGAGPIGVSAVRYGYPTEDLFSPEGDSLRVPDDGVTLIRRFSRPLTHPPHSGGDALFEVRQALPSYGLGALELIPDEALIDAEDPDDLNGDGVRGLARRLADGQIGRFGWKSQLPSLRAFIADAVSMELGLTLPVSLNLASANTSDDDDIDDPELSVEAFDALDLYLRLLAPPSLVLSDDPERQAEDEALFSEVGCAACHTPMISDDLPRPAFTNLLLHDVQSSDYIGAPEGEVHPRLFRTTPLWGLSTTAPYWHDGRATTIEDAITLHRAEARGAQRAYLALSAERKARLLDYLNRL
jgi:CxxC motif-containing protein (DUF1111 family)